jgi:hypothetical protein
MMCGWSGLSQSPGRIFGIIIIMVVNHGLCCVKTISAMVHPKEKKESEVEY